MLEKQLVYFCKINAPSEGIDKTCEFYLLKECIKQYIQQCIKEKCAFKTLNFEEINNNECIVIAFARMKDLQDEKTYCDIVDGDKGLRRISSYKGDIAPKNFPDPNPIILIGMEDIMQDNNQNNTNVSSQKNTTEDNNSKNKKVNSHNILEKLNLDPRFRFWDSSIWHRYVPLNEDFETNFGEVLEETKKYLKQGLYSTNVSVEFLEFETRMLVNSYLAPIGKGGHATDVTPYKFHSETAMKKNADEKLKEITPMREYLEWRFLLIDDYANVPLKGKDENNKTKSEIIHPLINIEKIKQSDICGPPPNQVNQKEPSKNVIKWALKELKGKIMYDIILLDYLLGDNGKWNRRELGSEFLEHLNVILEEEEKDDKNGNPDNKKITKNKGPLGRFWIFPISVFSYAILDEIHQKGIGHISDNWYLSTGADPVNTPQLFRYHLYRFMGIQIKDSPEDEDLRSFLEKSFESEDVCKAARERYPEFIKLRSQYEILDKDEKQDSLFAKSISKKPGDKISKAIWEHLSHLIYLLAYGSGVEWPEMWEEYNYVKKHFNKDDTEFMNKIRKYIIQIKSD